MIDGRLLLPAITAWLGAILAGVVILQAESDRHGRATAIAVMSAAALAILVVAWLTSVITGRLVRSTSVALALTTFVIGVLAGSLHWSSISAEPLASWVRTRATATMNAVVIGEAVRRTIAGGPAWLARTRLEVPIAATGISSRGVSLDVDVPFVLRLADGAAVPPPGSAIVVSGRLGPVPGGVSAAGSMTPARDVLVVGEPGWVNEWAHGMRVGLRSALDGTSADGGALVAGLAVGDESLQSEELDRAMRMTGLSHLTAVSGGNVAIVVITVLGIVTVLGLPIVARVTAALVALMLFVVLVGPQPSVLRAAVMGAVVLVGMLVGGRRSGPSVLAASVLVLVVVSPSLAMSWAFALSVGATSGLILLAPRLRGLIDTWRPARRWPPGLRDAVAIAAAAQLATLPVLLLMGASTGWVSLPANLLAMPAVPAVTVLGLLAALVSPFGAGIAHVLAVVASWPASWIAGVALVGSGLPLVTVPWPGGPVGVVLLAAFAAAAWWVRRWSRRAYPTGIPRWLSRSALIVVAATILLWLVAPPDRRSWPPPDWIVIMCDVGQGDALLLRTSQTAAVVVDAGGEPDLVDTCLTGARVSQIPAIVLTHFHADHVGGLSGVLRGRTVGAVYVSPVRDPAEQAAEVDDVLAAAGLSAIAISAGDERVVGDLRWRALWPRRVIKDGSVPNNASIVLAVEAAGRSILLTGDIELPAQAAIVPDLVDHVFDVVKVPHHGSRDQDPRLARLTDPAVALISVGEGNTYGHPADETVAAWEAVGTLVARTDQTGDVALVTSEDGLAVVPRN